MRADDKTLRGSFETLDAKLTGLNCKLDRIDARLTALLWLVGAWGSLIILLMAI